jgi:hypothetical protein
MRLHSAKSQKAVIFEVNINPITLDELLLILMSFKNKTTTGPDEII